MTSTGSSPISLTAMLYKPARSRKLRTHSRRRGFAKTGLERNHKGVLRRKLVIPFHPTRESQLIMQH